MVCVTLDQLRAKVDESPFFRDLLAAVAEGRRDYVTGGDQVVSEYLDPRVSGRVDGTYLLARCLASAWRCPEEEPLLPVVVILGEVGTPNTYREFRVEEWSTLARLSGYDGGSSVLPSGSRMRRFILAGETRSDVVRESQTTKKELQTGVVNTFEKDSEGEQFSLTLRLGVSTRDALLSEAMTQAGVTEGKDAQIAGILIMVSRMTLRDEVDGGVSNAWRPGITPHLDGSHLTPVLARLLTEQTPSEIWTDNDFRAELKRELASSKGLEPTTREFFNALANASPLRSMFPVWLTRYFPEVETIFWCNGDPLWDKSSPGERLAVLHAAAGSQKSALGENPAFLI